MRTLRNFAAALDCLRTLVEAKAWDYCIIWKSRDDSYSRFIDWVDCCCSGGKKVDADEEEEGGKRNSDSFCKDTRFRHFKRTEACEALAQFPSSILLNSASWFHGDVLISNQPIWLTNVAVSTSDSSQERSGTRVLIPISAGIIELFCTQHIPRDKEVIDFVSAHCYLCLEQGVVKTEMDVNFNEQSLHSVPKYCSLNWSDPQPFVKSKSTSQILPPVSQTSSFPSREGSSSDSKPSNEQPYSDSHPHFISNGFFNKSVCTSVGSKKQQRYVASNILLKDAAKTRGGQQNEKYQSKNLITERKRRNRIRDRLYALRALVPNISKMDRASIIVDAMNYIKELEENVNNLRDELVQLEHEDFPKNKWFKFSSPEREKDELGNQLLIQHDQPTLIIAEEKPMEVQVEVAQINERDFLIKLFCEQKQGGIIRLIEAIDSLGLQVIDLNITTFDSKVLNILHVEANKNNIQASKLRDSLITNQTLKQALQGEKVCNPDS